MKSKFIFADLFAGVGGMRLAFESAGGECVLTSELDENALRTYFLNFPPSTGHVTVRDVNELRLKDFGLRAGQLDVLVAGFPCQPYSIAGLRKGLDDDRGGQIFTSLLRILREVRPKSFLLENVKGIKSHDNGETFDYMCRELSNAGYALKNETLNSFVHANVPQNRERVFIVGFKDPQIAKKFKFPEAMKLTKSIEDCLVQPQEVGAEHYYDDRYPSYRIIEKEVTKTDTVYQWRRQYVRENMNKVCPTLTANMGSGGHNVPLVRDSRGIRRLTPREAANFQGFPRQFLLPPISNGHLYHQFGNSVTVPLIERIAKNIQDAFEW